MDVKFSEGSIELQKELNYLDKLAIDFSSLLSKTKINHVIISGYEAILFGRNRASEDIDLFIEKIGKEKFQEFWNLMQEGGFWCINADLSEAFSLLEDKLAIRFARKDEATPNIEVKFAKTDLDFYSLSNKIKVVLNGNEICIGPIELNIAYKLYLGSAKDIEDAVFLYEFFKNNLDRESLINFIRLLKVEHLAEENLWPSQ